MANDNVEIQGLEFLIKENSEDAVKSLEALTNTLNRLKTATAGGVSGLERTAKQITAISTAMIGLSSGKAQTIRDLAAGLTSLSGVGKISSSIGKQLTSIGTALIGITSYDAAKVTSLANALAGLSTLKGDSFKTFLNQLKRIPKIITELDAVDLAKFTTQMTDLATAMKPFADEMSKVAAGFSAFPARIQRLIRSTDAYNAAMSRSTKSTLVFGLKFGALYALLRRTAKAIGDLIEESNTYQEDLNLFMVSMGDYADVAKEYADAVSEIMGIDPAAWMRNQGVFQTLITGFGDTADRAYIMSKNLTQLGYDISSFFNISADDAMQKLQSGVSGELEPLRRLGFDLSAARLQQEAYALGIDKTVNAMTQAEKAELRYYAIMTQVTTAQGDMARTLNLGQPSEMAA